MIFGSGRGRHSGRRQEGAAVIEFALIVTLLFLIVFGIVQFSIALHRKQSLEAAAREGARLASIGATQQAIVTRVRESQSLFDEMDVIVSFSHTADPPCAGAGLGNTVQVIATVQDPQYDITIPLWGNQTITYQATGSFRCERTGT